MPLREDLLEPIVGDNPSGPNLYYDKLFDQIKEARTEDLDVGSSGAWERAQKKADHVLVIKLAGEALAKRSKDLRLAGWLIESHVKREGVSVFAPCLDLLWKLQEQFWETIHPEIEEDGDLGLRIGAIESVIARLATLIRLTSITRTGLSSLQYQESRRVGYEKDAETTDKQAARQDAIDHGKITGEDFDTSFNSTPKPFYVAAETSLTQATMLLDELDSFHAEKYGDDYPGLGRLVDAVREVKQTVSALLNEKRKAEPDAAAEVEVAEPEPEVEEPVVEWAAPVAPALAAVAAPVQRAAPKAAGFAGVPTTREQAFAAAWSAAEFLHGENTGSPEAYLICTGLRLGETRREGASPASDFAVAPPTETRQALRRLGNESGWDGLMKLCLRTLMEPCGRAWLDLQRYTWRAAQESGANAVAQAVVSTVRGLLTDLPEVRGWTLDDDTPAGNAETQAWIDAEVLPLVAVVIEEPASAPVVETRYTPVAAPSDDKEDVGPSVFEQAMEMVQHGRAGEAIGLLARDADGQTSGRRRFERRVEIAQLCLAADREAIAYPLLSELACEMERRNLESWESGAMLAHPLSLLLLCMDKRDGAGEQRAALFDRLCRLDPEAALATDRR